MLLYEANSTWLDSVLTISTEIKFVLSTLQGAFLIFTKGQVDFLYGNSRVEAEAKEADKKQNKQRLATRLFILLASMARTCIKMTLVPADRHCPYRGQYNRVFFSSLWQSSKSTYDIKDSPRRKSLYCYIKRTRVKLITWGPFLETPDNFPGPLSIFSSSFICQPMVIIGANLAILFTKLQRLKFSFQDQ